MQSRGDNHYYSTNTHKQAIVDRKKKTEPKIQRNDKGVFSLIV